MKAFKSALKYGLLSVLLTFSFYNLVSTSIIIYPLSFLISIMVFIYSINYDEIKLKIVFNDYLDYLYEGFIIFQIIHPLLIFIFMIVMIDNSNLVFISWVDISLMSIIRFFCGIYLANFYMGYYTIKIINREFFKSFCLINKLIISFIVSNVISLIMGIVNLFINGVVSKYFAVYGVFIYSFIIYLLYIVSYRGGLGGLYTRKKQFELNIISLNIIILIIFFIVGYVIIYLSFGNSHMMHGDLMNHHGVTMNLISNGITKDISAYYPYYHIILANMVLISGLPSMNAFVLFGLLNIYYILSFYSLTKSIFYKDIKLAVTSTIFFTIFNGFEWIMVYINIYSVNNYDLYGMLMGVANNTWHGILYSSFQQLYYYAPHSLGMIYFINFLYFSRNNKLNKSIIYQIIFFLTILLSLTMHLLEYFIIGILIMSILVTNKIYNKKINKIIIYMYFLAGITAIFFDILLMKFIYIRRDIVFIILINLLIVIVKNVNIKPIKLKITKLRKIMIFLLMYLVGISFIIIYNPPHSLSDYVIYGAKIMPWFFYPLKIGVIIFLFLIYLFNMKTSYDDIKSLITIMALLGSSKIISYVNISMTYLGINEKAIFPYLIVFFSILSAQSFIYILGRIKKSSINSLMIKRILSIIFVSLIFLSGTYSTLFQIFVWNYRGQHDRFSTISEQDIEAIEYFRNEGPGRIIILKNTPDSYDLWYKLENLAGRIKGPFWAFHEDWNKLELDTFENPESFYYYLRTYLNVTYVGVTKNNERESTIKSHSLVSDLIKYSQLTFDNDIVSVYRLSEYTSNNKPEVLVLFPDYVEWMTKGSTQISYKSKYPEGVDFFTESAKYWVSNSPDVSFSLSNQSICNQFSVMVNNFTGERNLDLSLDELNISKYSQLDFYIKSNLDATQIRLGSDSSNYFYKSIGNLISDSNHFVSINIQIEDDSSWNMYGNPIWDEITFIRFNVLNNQADPIFIDGLYFVEKYAPHLDDEGIKKVANTLGLLTNSGINMDICSKEDFIQVIQSNGYDVIVLPYDLEYGDPMFRLIQTYVEHGGNILVINSLGEFDFASMLGLSYVEDMLVEEVICKETSIHIPDQSVRILSTNDSNTETIACYYGENNYEGLVYKKSIGGGNIYYLNINSFLNLLFNDQFDHTNNYNLSKVLNEIYTDEFPQNSDFDYQTHDLVSKHLVNLNGLTNLTSYSTSLFFDFAQARSITFLKNDEIIKYVDVTIESLNITKGSINSINLCSNNTNLLPMPLGKYALLNVKSADLEILMDSSTKCILNIIYNNEVVSIPISNTIIRINQLSSVDILMKKLHIQNMGKTIISKVWASEDIIRDVQARLFTKPLVITGKTNFDVLASDGTYLFLSNFDFDGEYVFSQKPYQNKPTFLDFEISSIPWQDLMFSTDHLMLLSILLMGFFYSNISMFLERLNEKMT